MSLQRLYQKLTAALAQAANDAAEVYVEDIKAQVPTRTRKLQQSYRISRRARPGSLHVRIGPATKYGNKYYPWRSDKRAFGRRQVQRPPRTRLFGEPRRTSEGRRVSILRGKIKQNLDKM